MEECYFCDIDVINSEAHILGCWHKTCWREYRDRLKNRICIVCNVAFNKTERQDENYTQHAECNFLGSWSGYNK